MGCCIQDKSHHNDDRDGIENGDSPRRVRKQYNSPGLEKRAASSYRFQCGIFSGKDEDVDYGWYGGLDDDEESGLGSVRRESDSKGNRKGKFPGDYTHWVEEPNYGGRTINSGRLEIPPPTLDLKIPRSQSVVNLSTNNGDHVVANPMSDMHFLNDSIITVNHDGFKANIMREDLMIGKSSNNEFISFDSAINNAKDE